MNRCGCPRWVRVAASLLSIACSEEDTGGRAVGAGGATGAGGSAPIDPGSTTVYGEPYTGGEFHLGPVAFAETEWHNACAPADGYRSEIQRVEGNLLAGLWGGLPDVAGLCDACILVETDMGKSALLRVVTYGDTTENSIDVSPEAYALIDSGEYPRWMTWQLAKCPDTGNVLYEFQTGSNEWWTSLWVRNARLPIERAEVMGENHSGFVALERASDGTLTDPGGFGQGPFSLRLTAIDGSQRTDSFDWPGDGIAGALLEGDGNFE